MKIKKEELKEIRKSVAEQLSKVPEGQRIKLPREQLETHIFDSVHDSIEKQLLKK